MPDQSTSGFPESLSDAQTKNNRLCSKLIYVPLSPQSSSVLCVLVCCIFGFHGSEASAHMFLWGRGGSLCACSTAQLWRKELNCEVSHKKGLDTVHSVLFESDRMWVKSLVFREAHDGWHDEYHLLLGGIASFFIFNAWNTNTHTDTHIWHSLLPLILSTTSHSGCNKTPQSWASRIFSAVIGSPGSVAPSYRRWEVEG